MIPTLTARQFVDQLVRRHFAAFNRAIKADAYADIFLAHRWTPKEVRLLDSQAWIKIASVTRLPPPHSQETIDLVCVIMEAKATIRKNLRWPKCRCTHP